MKEHPCRHCKKANMDFVDSFEYGCFDPCQEAEDYFADIGRKIDELIKRANELLKGSAE